MADGMLMAWVAWEAGVAIQGHVPQERSSLPCERCECVETERGRSGEVFDCGNRAVACRRWSHEGGTNRENLNPPVASRIAPSMCQLL